METHQLLKNNHLSILLFHGVVKKNEHPVRNYLKKHIEEAYFYDLIKNLNQEGTALSMDEVVYHHKNKLAYPKNAFAVTFDDGFENNYSVAAPILDQLKVPAMFYTTTDFIENNSMSWIDKIEYAVEKSEGGELKFDWGDQVWPLENTEQKMAALNHIRSVVKKDNSIDIDKLVSDIFQQLNIEEITASDDPLDKKMNWQQVEEISQYDKFSIGGHTHTHAMMAFLSADELNTEIDQSLNLLKTKGNVETNHYSYPEGQAQHYSQEVIDALKKRGIICSPTAIDGFNNLDTDLFHLKRIMVT